MAFPWLVAANGDLINVLHADAINVTPMPEGGTGFQVIAFYGTGYFALAERLAEEDAHDLLQAIKEALPVSYIEVNDLVMGRVERREEEGKGGL